MFSEYSPEEGTETIQLITSDEDNKLDESSIPDVLPILPLRNTVLFPGVVIPITVGRKRSIKLVKKAYKGSRIIGVVAQKNDTGEEPGTDDIYQVGTLAKIVKMLILPDGNTTIIIQGKQRFKIENIEQEEPYLTATFSTIEEHFPEPERQEAKAVLASLKDAASKILKLNPDIPQEAQLALDNIESPSFLTHFLSSNITASVEDKQRLLEMNDGLERATALLEFMMEDIKMLELKHEIQQKVHSDIDQQQRDYFLRQQMKVLQDELGQEGPDQEIAILRAKGKDKKWPKEVAEHFEKELNKIQRMNPGAAEYPVAMNYAEFLTELPWEAYTEDIFDLKRAQKILDADHYGMEKIKDRIMEYLAVLKLKQNMKAPILCLYGPPGVGKTSLGKSIAKAMGRKYVRMSLGGVHDEAEIRGHRKTYIGAMPGKVMQNIKKAKAGNPVFILDEIDKVGSDFRGDPASALLEVLDPEQNDAFLDNYLEVEYDLSKVLFIATANSLDTIHPALRDRMEIITLSGYAQEEKIEIAKRHLVPKQLEEHGLTSKQVQFNKAALAQIVQSYTRESGVRGLERKIAAVVRNVAKQVAMQMEEMPDEKPEPIKLDAAAVSEILGKEMFALELYQDNETAGIVAGLAYTSYGGDMLFIEASLSRGNGKITISGQLGDVMKESAMAALSYIKSKADWLNIDHRIFKQYDLHLHVPEGSQPKDGPSAGITMVTALASIYTQRKVRNRVAMTGEITLRGKVLPIGGVKEKLLAARRGGIKELIFCQDNQKDVEELDKAYLKGLKIHYVNTAEDVLEIALLGQKVKKAIDFVLEDPIPPFVQQPGAKA